MRDDVSLSGIEPELQEDGPGRGSRSFRFPRTHGRKPDFPVALDHRNSGSRGHGVRERSVMVKILSIVTGAPGNTGQVLITFQTIGILPEGIVHGQYAGWFDYGVLCEEIPKGMLEP